MKSLDKTNNRGGIFYVFYNTAYWFIDNFLSKSYVFAITGFLMLPFIFIYIYIVTEKIHNGEAPSVLIYTSSNTMFLTSITYTIWFIIAFYNMIIFGTHILFSFLDTNQNKENSLSSLNPFIVSRKYQSMRISCFLREILAGNTQVQKGSLVAYLLIGSICLYAASLFHFCNFNLYLEILYFSTPFIVTINAFVHFLIILCKTHNTYNQNGMILYTIFVRHALLGTTVLSFLIYIVAIIYNLHSAGLICILFPVTFPFMLGVVLLCQVGICLFVYPFRRLPKMCDINR